MNTVIPPLLLPSPSFARRLFATVRACVWSVPQVVQGIPPERDALPRRVAAITTAGCESARLFGRNADPAAGVRVSSSAIRAAVSQPTCRARPGMAHVSSKTANRVTVIR